MAAIARHRAADSPARHRATTRVATLPTTNAVEPAARPRSWGRNLGLMTVATVAVSAGNYAFSLVAVHLLAPQAFSTFAATQGLLLVLGTGCMAAVPWAVARYMVTEHHVGARHEALRFALIASWWQAVIVGPVAGIIIGITAGPLIGVITAVSGVIIALTAAPTGYLQGDQRLGTIAALRVMEMLGRLVFGLGLVVVVAPTAGNALLGFPVGSGLLLIGGLLASRGGFPLRRAQREAMGRLIRQSFALGLVQVLIAMLSALDSVVAHAVGFDPVVDGSYQAASLLGRIPLFLSAAIVVSAYTTMAAARTDDEVGLHLRKALLIYGGVAAPIVVLCCTVPTDLLQIVIPPEYTAAPMVLRFTVISGALIGLISIIATAHQARGEFRRLTRILLPLALLQPVLLMVMGRATGILGFAWTLVGISVAGALAICWNTRRWVLSRRWTPKPRWALAVIALTIPFLISNPLLWIVYGVAMSVSLVAVAARAFSSSRSGPEEEPAPTPSGRHSAVTTPGEDTPPPALKLRRRVIEGENPDGPRVIVIGDSLIFGLGFNRRLAFGRLVADGLDFSALLNLSASARTPGETLELYAEAIVEFRPTVVVASIGASEAMVHPRIGLQRMIERYAPASWHGVAGLEPRAKFSDNRMERLRQKVQSALKVAVKWTLIRGTGGGPRVPLVRALPDARALLSLLEGTGAQIYLVGFPHAPALQFPGTEKSFRATEKAHQELAADRPSITYLSIADRLDYYGDFLGDRIHLGEAGHRRIADLVLELTSAHAVEAEPVGR